MRAVDFQSLPELAINGGEATERGRATKIEILCGRVAIVLGDLNEKM